MSNVLSPTQWRLAHGDPPNPNVIEFDSTKEITLKLGDLVPMKYINRNHSKDVNVHTNLTFSSAVAIQRHPEQIDYYTTSTYPAPLPFMRINYNSKGDDDNSKPSAAAAAASPVLLLQQRHLINKIVEKINVLVTAVMMMMMMMIRHQE